MTHSNDTELSDDVANLKRDFSQIRDDVKNLSSHLVERGRDSASSLGHQVGDGVQSAAHSTQEYVREHPLTTAAIAAGAGLLIGTLLARRRP